MEFPDDQPLTDNAKHLIRSLLTDQKNRIGYTDLAMHPFFQGLDWTTLQDGNLLNLNNSNLITMFIFCINIIVFLFLTKLSII